MQTTRSSPAWSFPALSVADYRQQRREQARRSRRASSGASATVRQAAAALAAAGSGAMTFDELVAAAMRRSTYTRVTLVEAVKEEARDGALARVRHGVYRVRASATEHAAQAYNSTQADQAEAGSSAADHVLRALCTLTGTRRREVAARDVLDFLHGEGIVYASRTIRHALARLSADPASPVLRAERFQYRLADEGS